MHQNAPLFVVNTHDGRELPALEACFFFSGSLFEIQCGGGRGRAAGWLQDSRVPHMPHALRQDMAAAFASSIPSAFNPFVRRLVHNI